MGCRAPEVATRTSHDGLAVTSVDVGENIHDLSCGFGIERGDWLVGEYHFGLLRQCAGDGHALLLTTGQCGSALPGAVSQPHAVQRSQRLLLLLGTEHAQRATPARHAAKKAQQHVVQHTEAVD